jgi:uncharacterized protein YuzB (UPF0349 family)
MIIKFYCDKHCADFTKDELEVIEQGQSFTHCAICGGKLHILNIDEVVDFDLQARVKSNINKWVKLYGWDYVIDLVKKYKDYYAVGRLYIEELQKRGFKIK